MDTKRPFLGYSDWQTDAHFAHLSEFERELLGQQERRRQAVEDRLAAAVTEQGRLVEVSDDGRLAIFEADIPPIHSEEGLTVIAAIDADSGIVQGYTVLSEDTVVLDGRDIDTARETIVDADSTYEGRSAALAGMEQVFDDTERVVAELVLVGAPRAA